MRKFLSIMLLSFILVSQTKAFEFTELVEELRECVSTHNLSEETCARLMSIYYESQHSVLSGVRIDFHYSDYSCSASNFVAGITIDYSASDEQLNSSCRRLARKVEKKQMSVWGHTIDKGSCQNNSDIYYNSTDELIKLCKDLYEGNV